MITVLYASIFQGVAMNPIGEYVKRRRREAGLTQEEFALRSGLGLRFVRELEQGKVNTVITKDLSRLGRDMRESSYYAEQFFPENGKDFFYSPESAKFA